jgi:hypothetical protein
MQQFFKNHKQLKNEHLLQLQFTRKSDFGLR